MDDKDIVTSFENLYKAYRKAKRGKPKNGSRNRFSVLALDGVNQIQKQLLDGSYRISNYNEFKIYEPKERIIKSCSFKDKVVQHCLCDNILHPKLKNVFIEENYAGQVGKGTHKALDGLKEDLESFYSKYGTDGWILKCDISKFFYTIEHEKLKDIVDYYFESDFCTWLNHLFIDSTENPGLPLGNQVSQIYALLFLHQIDILVKGELGIEYYGRYMDDFYLIFKDKEYLKFCLEAIKEMVNSLDLELNGKTQIVPIRKGIRFLGFHHYITGDGKYIRKLSGENKRNAKRKINRCIKAVERGQMSQKKFDEKYGAWKNHASHGNCVKLIRSIDDYIKERMNRND